MIVYKMFLANKFIQHVPADYYGYGIKYHDNAAKNVENNKKCLISISSYNL